MRSVHLCDYNDSIKYSDIGRYSPNWKHGSKSKMRKKGTESENEYGYQYELMVFQLSTNQIHFSHEEKSFLLYFFDG